MWWTRLLANDPNNEVRCARAEASCCQRENPIELHAKTSAAPWVSRMWSELASFRHLYGGEGSRAAAK